MPTPDEIPAEIEILGSERNPIELERVANFCRDLVFLHDRFWLLGVKNFREHIIASGYFYTRNGRPIPQDQRLQLVSLQEKSPISIVVAVLAISVALPFFKLLRGALLLPGELRQQLLNVRKTQSEIELKELEKQRLAHELEDLQVKRLDVGRAAVYEARSDLKQLQHHRPVAFDEAERIIARDIDRLRDNEIAIVDVIVKRYRKE